MTANVAAHSRPLGAGESRPSPLPARVDTRVAQRRPRVVVTRTGEGAARLCALLEAAGLEPVRLPAIAIELVEDTAPLDAVVAQLDGYEWIVFPSANAARIVLDRARVTGRRLDHLDGDAGPRVVAGPATARVVMDYGLPVAFAPSPFSAERAVQALAPVIRPGSRVLLPRAEEGLDRLASGLRALGAVVDEVVAYRTVRHDQAAEAVVRELAAGRIDGVTFFSPSAVTAWTDALAVALPPARQRALRDEAVVACIGPTTAAAEAAGWRVAVVPSDTTASALVAALAAHLRGRTSRRSEERV